MKTLYLECNMGAAGDMLMAALYELVEDKDGFLTKMNRLGLPGVHVDAQADEKCGINGTRMRVLIHGEEEQSADQADGHGENIHHEETHVHHHSDLEQVTQRIAGLDVSEQVRKDIEAVYQLIAEAESHVHGKPVEQIHFHEVGTMDALADVTGVCLLMEMLAPERVEASLVHVGSGSVHCAHGILPVPAPATAYLLQGIPTYSDSITGELCTPTGAALLKHFVDHFGEQPVMKVTSIGYGMGSKDFPAANCLRALLGETEADRESIIEIRCNLDDMTPEQIGFAQEQLFAAGALDVYTISIGMKKCRLGVLLTCMCRADQREEMIRTMFKHTTTLGIRETLCNRYTLQREERVEETADGPVRIKTSTGWGVTREKREYEDLAAIARDTDGTIL